MTIDQLIQKANLIRELWEFANRVFSCVHDDELTYSPLSPLSRRHIEDVHLVSSIWFIIRLDVYREFLHKGTRVPERHKRSSSLEVTMQLWQHKAKILNTGRNTQGGTVVI